MKKQIYLFFFFSFIACFSAQGQYPEAPNEKDAEGRRTGRWTILYNKDSKPTTYKDSVTLFRVITYNKGVPSGKVYDYYISGALQAEMNLITDQPEDVYDGQATIFYEKGNVKFRCHFEKGILSGKYEEYHPNGMLKAKTTYVNGQAEGSFEYFYESGERSASYLFKNGKLNGPRIMYSTKGTFLEKGQYLDGMKTGYWEAWFENGAKEYEGNFINDKKEGKWIYYYENSILQSVGNYSNDLKEGEWKNYFESGQLKSSGSKKKDLREGTWIYNYPSGKLEEIDNYVTDTAEGSSIVYYESGGIKTKANYKKGKENGVWEHYYENGKIQRTVPYTDGIIQGYRAMYSDKGILTDKTFYENNLQTGLFIQYFEDGTVKQKGNLVNEKKEGWSEEYFPDGKLQLKSLMHDNLNNGAFEMYFQNGNLQKKGTYKNGIQEDHWEFFHENGKIQSRGKFVNGKKEGLWEWYFDNGQLDGKGNMKNDNQEGPWEEFYSNGKLRQKGLFADSANKEGPWIFYFENGNINRKGNYKNGWRVGTWEYYYQNGALDCKGKMDHSAQGKWIYYDSLAPGTKVSILEFKDGKKEGEKITYKNGKADTVYVFHQDVQITIGVIIDSIENETNKHHFKEAEQLITQLQKMQSAQYSNFSVYRHMYLKNYATLYYTKKEYEKSIKYSLQLLSVLKKYNLDTTQTYSVVQNNLANNYSDMGKYSDAINLYKQSLNTKSEKIGINDIHYFITINNISLTYKEAGKLDSALITLESYLENVKAKYGEVDSAYYQALEYLARLHYELKDYSKANDYYFYTTRLLEKQGKTNKTEYRHTISGIANTYQLLNNYDSSLYFIKKAELLYKTNHDTTSGYYFYNWDRLADYYSKMGKADSAFAIHSFLLERMKDNPYIDYSIYKNTMYAIAGYYYDNERYEESLKWYLDLKLILEKDGSQSQALYGHTLQVIAYIYITIYTDKNQEASQLFETSVQNKKDGYGEESGTYLRSVSDLSRFYSLINEYQKAVTLGKALLPQIEKVFGKNNGLYAHHAEVLGDIYYNYSDYDQALPYYQTSYTFFSSNKQTEFIGYVDLACDLAICLKCLYKVDQAEKLYLTTIQEVEKKIGKENIQYLRLTNNLVDLYLFLNKDNSAKIYLKEAMPIAKKITGENGSYYFGYINRLAKIESNARAFAKSDSLLTILKNISLRHNGTSSKDYLTYLEEKANLEYRRENFKEAEIYYIQSLKLSGTLYGKNSQSYAIILKKTALFYNSTQRYAEAEELLLKAKNIIETIFGNTLLEYSYYAEALAQTYALKGEYSKSEKFYEEAITIYEKENTKNSWNYLNTLNSKAKMYVTAGLYNKAMTDFELYLKTVEGFVGKDGNYALALSEIAGLFRYASLYNKAIEYQIRSQKLIDSIYSFEDYKYISGLNILGLIYLDANLLDSAAYNFNEYKRIIRKLYPQDSLAIAIYYNNYALVCLKKGNYEEAEKLLNASYRIREKSINQDPSLYINFFDNYAQLYTSWKKYENAEKYWNDVLPAILSYTNKQFGEFSEQEKTQFWSSYSADFEIYNSYCLLHRKTKPSVLQGMYDNRIATKAIVLNSINKLKKRIYGSRDSLLINKYEEWQVLRDRTARYHGVSPQQLKDAGISLDSLEKVQEHLEKDLNISVEDKKQYKTTPVSWKDIQKKLLPGEAAIEIIQFRNFTTYLTDSIVYAALLLTANTKENPELIVLPYGNKLETRYLNFYKNAIKFKSADTLSYKAFWQPLEKKLNGINTLYISLDGVYNQININTLMLPDGSYLLDKRKIIIVSNTKDIIPLKSSSQISKSNSSQGVHLFGYPNYDEGMDKLPAKNGNERDVTLNLDFASKNTITKLPGTKVEMEKIVVLLADKQWRFRSYQEDQATEDFVKQLQSPLVLHIATHGFFFGEDQVKLGAGGAGYMNGQKYNPLLMSGLMLTGATKSMLGYSSQEGENGILTALEASTLNLDNTELVILSACETGKGEIKVGEGVYGLQRAFQVAGSKATIMSLWKVDDNATQQLMESFYRYWMDSGNKTEAFRKAQLEVRQKFPSPYYWGAFVMMGQ